MSNEIGFPYSCDLTLTALLIFFPSRTVLTSLNARPPTLVVNKSYMQRCVIKVIGPCVASGSASVVPAVSGWFSGKIECRSP